MIQTDRMQLTHMFPIDKMGQQNKKKLQKMQLEASIQRKVMKQLKANIRLKGHHDADDDGILHVFEFCSGKRPMRRNYAQQQVPRMHILVRLRQ